MAYYFYKKIGTRTCDRSVVLILPKIGVSSLRFQLRGIISNNNASNNFWQQAESAAPLEVVKIATGISGRNGSSRISSSVAYPTLSPLLSTKIVL